MMQKLLKHRHDKMDEPASFVWVDWQQIWDNTRQQQKKGKNMGILKPSWALVETNIMMYDIP